jgi:hypothetical protein
MALLTVPQDKVHARGSIPYIIAHTHTHTGRHSGASTEASRVDVFGSTPVDIGDQIHVQQLEFTRVWAI